MASTLAGRDLISTMDLGDGEIALIFETAAKMKRRFEANDLNRLGSIMKHRVLAEIFEEPSTRTYGSTNVAMLRLGGTVVTFVGAKQMSSLAKGESFEDMGQTLSEMLIDIIAMRHSAIGSVQRLADGASVPVINCGDGAGKHPTQALLDAKTVRDRIEDLSSSTMTLLGDLRNGRTVHENGPLFARLGLLDFFLVSPPTLAMPEDVIAQMKSYGAKIEVCMDVEDALRNSNFLYDTRIQGERFEDPAEYEAVRGAYVVDAALVARTNPRIHIMHPLPRVDELADDVINSPNCLCWEQVRNGVFVRMALLALLTGAI